MAPIAREYAVGAITPSRSRPFRNRILTIIDEASRECLALVVARQLRHEDVLAALAELFVTRGPPAHIRSDTAPNLSPMPSRNGSARSA